MQDSQMIYDKGFDAVHITGLHDKKIKEQILKKLSNNAAFINTTWIELDSDLKRIIQSQPNLILCYSTVDWENRICRQEPNNYIKENAKNLIYFGNYNNGYYFSFWMDFVFEHISSFEKFDCTNVNKDMQLFMCLNRKPHEHRIELVRKLYDKNLDKQGFISLGKHPKPVPWDYKGLSVPITLQKDIENQEGNLAVAGNAGGITNDITGLGSSEYWNSHFLNIVTETTVHTDVFISEKTFKPIIGMRPFVILGDDAVYEKLHEWGFDTFDDIFGKGYLGKYHTDRIEWIVGIVEDLKRANLNLLFKKLLPRLKENKRLFLKVAKQNRQRFSDFEVKLNNTCK